MKKINFGCLWSATPTPLTLTHKVDAPSVRRLVDHHIRLGVNGIFLGGTCGEGAWLPVSEVSRLTQIASKHAGGRISISVQVTDNSSDRILENLHRAKRDGAQLGVIAAPYFMMGSQLHTLWGHLSTAIRKSPLKICIYDRGAHEKFPIPSEVLMKLYAEPNVVMMKDSSGDRERRQIALRAKRSRPELQLLTGDEFKCVDYLRAGYDGFLLGGAIVVGAHAKQMLAAFRSGNPKEAETLEAEQIRLLTAVYPEFRS